MRLFAKWILAGIAAGVVSGAPFGWPYMAAGAGIGAAAGAGIALGLRPKSRFRRTGPGDAIDPRSGLLRKPPLPRSTGERKRRPR